ncbi:MAG TPA: S8 family serine peptidase [Vicinamibacterales bacterium]|nr:S8 family serine peptidase [Vicinamibacterales bacterium]
MLRFRAGTFGVALLGAAALVLSLKGQTATGRLPYDIQDIGLPAVEENAIPNSPKTPAQAIDRARRAAAIVQSRARRSGSRRSFMPGKVIVRFRDEVSSEERVALARGASPTADLMARRSYSDFDVLRIDPGEDAEAVAAALAGRPQVVYAQPAYRVYPTFVPNDPEYQRRQWNLRQIHMEQAWDIQPQAGSQITVAVIDTGVAYRNATITANIPGFVDENGVRYPPLGTQTIPYSAAPQLVGGAGTSRIVAPFDVTSNGLLPPFDFDGHGTHVSGTIGQLTNDGIGTAGVAFNVKLMPVKVLSSTWDVLFGAALDTGGTDDDVATGIRYAADNGAKVINMSLGGPGPASCVTSSTPIACSPVIETALRYAVCTGPKTTSCSGAGAFVAVAAGNDFEDVDPDFGANPTSVIAAMASRIKGVVSVASVDPSMARAYYSTTGNYIELAAPGGSQRGFGSDGFVWQQTFDFNFTDTFNLPPSQYHAPRFDILATIGYIGTSQATPHVSGVAAMLMQQGITDPAAIEDALEAAAMKLTPPSDPCPTGQTAAAGRTCSFGFGLIDARNALRGLGLAR